MSEEKKPAGMLAEVKVKLQAYKKEIAVMLPQGLTADKVIQATYNSVRKNPELQKCSANSIVGCVLMASQLGFEFDGISNKAHMVPYWNSRAGRLDAQFQIGYRGLVELALRSGRVKHIEGHVVYKQDLFKCTFGTHGFLEHEPAWNGPRDDESILGFYALAHLESGVITFDFMTKEEVDKVKANTKSKDKQGKIFSSSPWVQHYAAMGIKTVLRRFCKSLPSDNTLDKAVTWDHQAASGDKQIVDQFQDELGQDDLPIADENGEVLPKAEEPKAIESKSKQAADSINVEDI